MITTLSALLGTKYGKYLLEVALVCGLVFGAFKFAEHRGRDAQRDQDNQAHAIEIEKSRKEAADAKDALVRQANEKATASEADAAAARAQFVQLAGILSNLDAKSKQGRDQVSALADSDLHGDIVSKLSIRKPGDSTPGYYAQEERSIDNSVTQYPIEAEKNKTLTGQVQQKDAEAKANKDTADARLQAFNTDESYITLLNKYYADIFNMHAPHKRAPKCLYLWGCGRVTVNLEPPKR
jgi:hypothetical protein